MKETPPAEVIRHCLRRHDAIYPGWHILWQIFLNLTSVSVYNEHLGEYVTNIATAWLHKRNGPIGMETIIEFQGRIDQFSIGIAIQVDMT